MTFVVNDAILAFMQCWKLPAIALLSVGCAKGDPPKTATQPHLSATEQLIQLAQMDGLSDVRTVGHAKELLAVAGRIDGSGLDQQDLLIAQKRAGKLVGNPLRIDPFVQANHRVEVSFEPLPGRAELQHVLIKTTFEGTDSSHFGEYHYVIRATATGLEQACSWPGSRQVLMSPAEGEMPSERVRWRVVAGANPLTIEVSHEGRHVEAEGERFARVTHFTLPPQGVCQAQVVSAQGDLPER